MIIFLDAGSASVGGDLPLFRQSGYNDDIDNLITDARDLNNLFL